MVPISSNARRKNRHLWQSLFLYSICNGLFVSPVFAVPVEKNTYGVTTAGKSVDQYTLANARGASAQIITYGATLTRLMVPDDHRKLGDVVLGFDTLAEYEKNKAYLGATIGRVANRIAKGTFSVDGAEYHLAINNGPNTLHGGVVGYDKRIWDAQDVTTKDGPAVRFSLADPDGTEGFPGTVNVTVTYTLTNENTLRIEYAATTDKTTPINLTNHTYWNLKDGGKGPVDDAILKIYADRYTPADANLIPTGEISPVKGTPLDFTSAKPIGNGFAAMTGPAPGYDHNLVLKNQTGKLAKAMELYEPDTGRVMELWTTEPGLQFYTANQWDGSMKGKNGIPYAAHSGVAFEPQHYPDSVHQPKFPSTLLRPAKRTIN